MHTIKRKDISFPVDTIQMQDHRYKHIFHYASKKHIALCENIFNDVFINTKEWLEKNILIKHKNCAENYSIFDGKIVINDRLRNQCIPGMAYYSWIKLYKIEKNINHLYLHEYNFICQAIFNTFAAILNWLHTGQNNGMPLDDIFKWCFTKIIREALVSSFIDCLEYYIRAQKMNFSNYIQHHTFESYIPYFVLHHEKSSNKLVLHYWKRWDEKMLFDKVKMLDCRNKKINDWNS